MRVALCLAGQFRTGEFCFPSINKHLLRVYKPDVFICSDERGERMTELYHPADIEIHSQEEIDQEVGNFDYPNSQTQPRKDISVWWKYWKCGEMLRKKKRKYDVVMFSRFDVKFLNIPKISIPEVSTLYIPRIDGLLVPPDINGNHFGGYSTQLCWGTQETAEVIYNLYQERERIYGQLGFWQAEIMIKKNCDNHGIVPKLVDISMMIVRGTSDAPLTTDLNPISTRPEYIGD